MSQVTKHLAIGFERSSTERAFTRTPFAQRRASSSAPGERLKSKEGRLRGTLMGKRAGGPREETRATHEGHKNCISIL